jgi:hypothetical protein
MVGERLLNHSALTGDFCQLVVLLLKLGIVIMFCLTQAKPASLVYQAF